MKIIGKTNKDYIMEISPDALKKVIGWDESKSGGFDLNKLEVGAEVIISKKYTDVLAIQDITNRINDAKIRVSQAFDQLNLVELSNIQER